MCISVLDISSSLCVNNFLSQRGPQAFVLPFGLPRGFPVYGLFFLLTDPFGLPRGFPVGTYVDFFTFFPFSSTTFFSTGAMSLL